MTVNIFEYLQKKDPTEKNGYYSVRYEDLLEAAGLVIEQCEYFGSYQDDAAAVVRDGVRKGISMWGYGSCSGCDALEADAPFGDKAKTAEAWADVNTLADGMVASVQWPRDGETFEEMAARLLRNETNEWYFYDSDIKAWVEKLAAGE